jgi:hypothetical protein
MKKIRIPIATYIGHCKNKITTLVTSIEKHLASLNRAQIRSVYALYHLYTQIEENRYDIETCTR